MAVIPIFATSGRALSGIFGSTTFTNRITSYELLGERVKRMLGYPLVQIEISDEQLYTIIDTACEYFTKFAGNTEEFLIFRSDLYTPKQGLAIGKLLNISPDLFAVDPNTTTGDYNGPPMFTVSLSEHDEVIGDGSRSTFDVVHNMNDSTVVVNVYDTTTNSLVYPSVSTPDANTVRITFALPPAPGAYKVVIVNGSGQTQTLSGANVPNEMRLGYTGWDFDMNNYRRVVDVSSFQEGSNTGINTLFTIEHAIAQQAYFGHLLGNVGYDLVTWQALKGWIETREKTLALTPYLRFYPETQMLKIIPEPTQNSVYFGLVKCIVQKPIKDIVSQLWVYRYTLALTKLTVAHTRGKFSGSILFGGQSVNYTDLMSQGLSERDKLEAEITSDLIDRDPIPFLIG